MDNVKLFIADNKYQLGYIMHEASRQWAEDNPVGALTVGECKAVVDEYGTYNELLEQNNHKKAQIELLITVLDSCKKLAENGHSELIFDYISTFEKETLKNIK